MDALQTLKIVISIIWNLELAFLGSKNKLRYFSTIHPCADLLNTHSKHLFCIWKAKVLF